VTIFRQALRGEGGEHVSAPLVLAQIIVLQLS
jgi:hypothetical protein